MTGCVVQVWFEDDEGKPTPKGQRPPFDLIETELEDFATFSELVDGDRLISGAILHTRKGEGRERTIVRRIPIIFRGSAVKRAILPTWRLVDEVE